MICFQFAAMSAACSGVSVASAPRSA